MAAVEREAPATWVERGVCMAAMAGAVAGIVWLAMRTAGNLDRNHTPEFLGLALLAGACLYLGWVLWALWSVRYILEGDRLLLRQGPFRRAVVLDESAHLHRWRRRWTWEGGAQRDLGVASVALFPPVWLGRSQDTWVLQTADKAVAFRPSAQLLGAIKARVRQPGTLAG